jgi:hypothetical protein
MKLDGQKGSVRAGVTFSFFGQGNDDNQSGSGFFTLQKIISS